MTKLYGDYTIVSLLGNAYLTLVQAEPINSPCTLVGYDILTLAGCEFSRFLMYCIYGDIRFCLRISCLLQHSTAPSVNTFKIRLKTFLFASA